MSKTLLSVFFLLLCLSGVSDAMDWKQLHEYTDSVTRQEALDAVQKNPESLESLYVLGLVYLNEYKVEEAESTFRRMLEIDLSSIEAQWGVAECLRRRRVCGQCIRLLDEIMASHPEFAPAYISAAYIKYISMDFESSADLSYAVIKLGPDRVDLTNYVRAYGLYAGAKGMIAHYGGPLSKVINGRAVLPALRKAQKLDPDAPSVLFGLGSYYMLIPAVFGRDLEKAEEYLLQAIAKDPLFADVYARLAQLYRAQGDYEKYKQFIKKALQLDPRNEIALDIENRTCRFVCIQN
jgi:tetratricopeptide (TPR) repeat protein